MKKKIFFFGIIFLLIISKHIDSKEINIITKIGNQVITNIDIENEYKYLVSLNNDYKKLEKNKIFIFAKNSLIKEKIKEIELKKYFEFGDSDSFLNNKIKEIYNNLGFSSLEEFQMYLNEFDLKVEDVAKKIEIELKWNKLIYDKYKNQIVINEKTLKKKIIDKSKKSSLYNLYELIFTSKNDIEDKKKISEITKSIKDVGFENTVLIFSEAESRKNSGNLGWINELSLSKNILEKLKNINISETSDPIKIQNGILIIKLNDKKMTDISSIDLDEELRKLIKFETNKQLNVFSSIYFEKIKNKINIYE